MRLWAGVALLALLVAAANRRPGGRLWPARRDWPACAFLGAILALHLYLQAVGLRFTTAIDTGWIIGFIPVMVALGAHLLGQQRIRTQGWAGVGLGTSGILAIVLSSLYRSGQPAAFGGDLLQVASCVTWTVYTLAATRPVARSGALRVTLLSMAFAALLNTLPALDGGFFRAAVSTRSMIALLFLGPVCSGLAYYLWFAAQHEHGPARLNALIYIEPFVSLVLGAALLGEPVRVEALVGGLCVLGGVWLVAHGVAAPRAAVGRLKAQPNPISRS